MKKRMYVVTNLDGDNIYYEKIEDALENIKIEINEYKEEDIEEDPITFSLSCEMMTAEEIAALPEYQG